jgi:pyruvate dehydrogenase E2 component (dihydrolipoamide acetyltransferase)
MAVTKVILAKLSPTMEEGTIVKWSKNEGDAVKPGDVLAEIETDKANMEMEALGGGVLRKILVPAGGKAPVGALIGVIADAKDDLTKVLASAGPAPAPAAPAPAPKPAEAAAPAPTPQPAPQAAPQVPAAPTPAPAPGPVPAPRAAEAPAASDEGGRVKASPLARKVAAERNIPLDSVAGSGPGGRIIKRDIEAWAQNPQASAAPASAAAPVATPGQELPLSGMRKTIARRLAESKVQSPHFYVTVEIDMDAAAAVREQIQRAEETKVSFNDLIVKASAKALRKFPR